MSFALDAHPDYRLVLAGNRDEFHARPTASAGWWEAPCQNVFGGRDLASGGSWLALSRSGRFAVVTNFRDPSQAQTSKRSRGHLVSDFVAGDASPREYLANLGDDYAGFNLLLGVLTGAEPELYYFSNRAADPAPRRLAAGVYGLSNHLLDTDWPKVSRTRERLRQLLTQGPTEDALFALLADREGAADSELPATGVELEIERLLASPFIVSPAYGTRASSLLWVTRDGTLRFVEHSFDAAGQCSQRQSTSIITAL